MADQLPIPLIDAELPPIGARAGIALVAEACGIELAGIMSQSREGKLCAARQVAVWLLRVRPTLGGEHRSLPMIGRAIRAPGLKPMDHSSCCHALKVVANRAHREPQFRALLDQLAHDRVVIDPAVIAQVAGSVPYMPPAGAPAPERLSERAETLRRRAERDAVDRALRQRSAPLRPVMALEEDDDDARARLGGSLKLAAALAAARAAAAKVAA